MHYDTFVYKEYYNERGKNLLVSSVLNVEEANICFSGHRPNAKCMCLLGISINSRITFRNKIGKLRSGNKMPSIDH